VVVVVGLTARGPVACTVPRELIVTVSAFSTDQRRVEELPEVIVAGDAVKLTTRGAEPSVTWTVRLHVTGPLALRAVSV
jgi:hypothetical protein